MAKKIVAYGCWSNDRHIQITDGRDAGVIHGALFQRLDDAVQYYKTNRPPGVLSDDPIVKVTVEIIPANGLMSRPATKD